MKLKSILLAAALLLPAAALAAPRSDEVTVTLEPGKGAEVKVDMVKGARTTYSWKAEGGVVNFDTHGEPTGAPDKTHSYEKGRGAAADDGEIVAAFDGKHGWFWRNRGSSPVTITLRAEGDYAAIGRVD